MILGLWSCSGGGGGGGRLTIESCSLGCSSSGSGVQLSCPISDVFVNQEIRVAFSQSVDLSSLNSSTFQVKEAGVGKTPAGSYELDSNDPRVVIYRPLLTFDPSGAPTFGFKEDATYNIVIPGTETDPNATSYVRSTSGSQNRTRMFCTIVASRGVLDVKPGQPRVTASVDVVSGTSVVPDQDPESDFDSDDPVVSRATDLTLRFNDVMNPATLVNPVTNESNSITIRVDTDGNLSGTSDQVELPGSFNIAIDQNLLTTTVVFQPDGELPSSGSDPTIKRRIVVDLPGTIEDLGGNPVVNPRRIVFTPEVIVFQPATLTEAFETSTREDASRAGLGWNGDGSLAKAVGGGSGRLGELVVPTGRTVVLSTDTAGEDFSGITDRTIFNPFNVIEPTVFGTVDPVTDGVFEFSRLRIDSGGTLRFAGEQPPRIYVRGEAVVQGILDVAGRGGGVHDSTQECGGVGGEPGPSGGVGGDGGVRPDGAGFESEGGEENILKTPVTLYGDVDGKGGGGIPVVTESAGAALVGGGGGGVAWPQPNLQAEFPTAHFPADVTDTSGMQYEAFIECRNRAPGGAGGGGGNAFDGQDGVARLKAEGQPTIDVTTPPPDSPGGDVTGLGTDPTLDPEAGYLRGGGGGGGGGAHLQETQVNGLILNDCTIPATGATLVIQTFQHHSSASGGGGGGAVQVQAGRRIQLDGVVDASGGAGGDSLASRLAQAGGGGAGGSILMQAPILLVQSVAGRIDVSGGRGGNGVNGSAGGLASPGFVRLETLPDDPLDFDEEVSKIAPTDAEVQADFPGDIQDIVSIGEWNPPSLGGSAGGPDTQSGVQSCWFRPSGNFFELEFCEDGGTFCLPSGLGWDMTVELASVSGPQPYRATPNDLFGNTSLEEGFGNQLGSAPLVVRFQGARALGVLPDPCNVQLAGIDTQIFPGSLTGWVEHPAELNDFFGDDPVLRPNIVRFAVIWDSSQPFYDEIVGIDEVQIPVQPD